ncbi:MAG: hypothetical protein HS108_11085 [Planctomycetes bacterium]|jgi:hypothetical protein|nr:hypothetical protein [Planctomycetota bacterium]MCL4730570.1 hypothetical protein [Planctomycetota bacterium]
MPEGAPEQCQVCGNHALVPRRVTDAVVRECEFCGHIEGPSELVELLELQREAEELGCSEYSYPLARFIDELPGVKLLGDSGGNRKLGTMPFVAFELSDHRTWQLENLGQALRLMREELSREWMIEFTFDYQLGFELRTRPDGRKTHDPDEIEAARRDLLHMWRRLRGYTALAWWKQG